MYRQLVRHFFGRFFDTESLSPQGDPQAGVVQTLGILAVPSAFFVLLFRPLTLWDWSLVGVRYLFVLYSMMVMGFVMVFEWDASSWTPAITRSSPRSRSAAAPYCSPKPSRSPSSYAIFLVDINFFGVLFWPGVEAATMPSRS